MKGLFVVLAVVFVAALIGCGGGGGKTPEAAVKNAYEALKNKDWEAAVSCMDMDGMTKQMREMGMKGMEGMPEKEKAEAIKKLDEMIAKMKETVIEEMKKARGDKEYSYKILETKDKKETSATVVVEVTKDGKPEKEDVPLIKVNGLWKIGVEK